MDIKLKNIKWENIKYSIVTKTIAVILVWLCFMGIMSGAWFFLSNQEIISNESYYETYRFVAEYSRMVHNAVELEVKLRNEGKLVIPSATPKVESSYEEQVNGLRSRLEGMLNFSYYIKNTETGEISTNINAPDRVALLKKQPTYVYLGGGKDDYYVYVNHKRSHSSVMYYYEDINKMLEGTPYEVHAAVIEPMKQGDMFYYGFANFVQVKRAAPYYTALAAASAALLLAALIYLIYAAGRRDKNRGAVLTRVDKIYTDVHTLLLLIAAILSLGGANELANDFGGATGIMIAGSIILSIDVFIALSYILSMVRQIKTRQILRNTLTYKLYCMIKGFVIMAFRGKIFRPWLILMLLGYGLINGILFSLLLHPYYGNEALIFIFSGFLLVSFNITVVYFAAKSLTNLTQIMEAVKEVSAGNLDYELNRNEISVAFLELTEHLQSLQKGLKSAVAEAVKGERMKTELITNVSHDLKTPLTSIINYVDLLKKEELDNPNAKEYVAILEEKSARLKQLVEDLIEASKASSGNLAVNTEKIDLHQLVMQAYGEYEEKLEGNELDMRISIAEGDILVNADGRHLWRIVENLMSNVLKYSMSKSRVYVNLDKDENYGILTIKNISAFPLGISPEQLTERFVRGDSSRSTEGSGLGLSIVQGLTQLQGGRFKIEIDGDLFKAIIEIPLWL